VHYTSLADISLRKQQKQPAWEKLGAFLVRYAITFKSTDLASRGLAVTPRQIEGALSRAQLICKMRGARLTPVRRRVLELILSSDQPAGAYALLAELRRGRGKLGPPTVYRALEFLLANKLIHKVETSSAFIACADIEHPHESQFMICDDCGATEELRDDEIVQSLRRLGEERGFAVERQVIEARGLCPACRSAQR
jgi:Fur family zinc uptake transcriptional regulator